MFSICNSFEFKVTQIYRSSMTDLVTCQHESRENVEEFFMTSPYIMPHPIISQIINANHKHEHDPSHKP